MSRIQRLIAAINVSRIYSLGSEEVHALRDVNMTVFPGQFIAVVGRSGSGKTTLLNIMAGLDRPTSGRLLFEGFDIFSQANVDLARFRNEAVGFVFQFHALLPEFTALENVMMPLMIGGARRSEAVRSAAVMLESVGLGDRAGHRPAQLSGGEQQRVAIARALAHQPRLLLADEPTGNLDSKTGEGVFSLLRTLHTAHGLTSVLVTHNERLAAACDRVLHLADGKLD